MVRVNDDEMRLPPFREGIFGVNPFALRGVRCAAGHTTFPARTFCGTCKSEDLEPVALSDHGTLNTFTVIRQAPAGVPVPYILGYVDLPECVRLLARIEIDLAEPVIGAGVDLVPAVFPGGDGADSDRLGFAFAAHPIQLSPDEVRKERHDA